MAFPATYDFNYYIGDTKDFVVVPYTKTVAFDLAGYTPAFVIATERAANPSWSVDGSVVLNATDNTLYCSISPDVGRQLTQARYYYDVEIRKTENGAEIVRTILQGTITPVMGVNKHV